MVYAATSLALAALEVLVHLPPGMRRAGGLPVLMTVALDFPDAEVAESAPGPDDRVTGDAWAAAGTSLALRVPSRVIAHDANLLINPRHPKIGLIGVAIIERFEFDLRLGQ